MDRRTVESNAQDAKTQGRSQYVIDLLKTQEKIILYVISDNRNENGEVPKLKG